METAAEFIDALRRRHSLPSDYAAAKLLKSTPAAVSKYRHGRDTFSDETACRVAELLAIDAGYVLACMSAQRSRTEGARSAWMHLARRLAPATVALLLVVGLGDWLGEPVSGALAFAASSGPLNIMSNAAWVLALALLLTRSGIAGRFSR